VRIRWWWREPDDGGGGVASRRTWMDERAHDVNPTAVGEAIGDLPAWTW
jgi:hypothetical protein